MTDSLNATTPTPKREVDDELFESPVQLETTDTAHSQHTLNIINYSSQHTLQSNRPDRGQTFMPSTSDIPDNAPQPLDHFKRGYNERAELRERETTGFNSVLNRPSPQPSEGHNHDSLMSNSISQISQGNSTQGEPKKWQPPAGVQDRNEECSQLAQTHPPNYYGPSASSNFKDDKQQRSYIISFNNNYNKYDDKQYTRSSNSYDDRQQRNYSNRHMKGNNPGFSMEEVVDRLCHPRTNVFEEMDHARNASPESFQSGRAITAILSQLGRRRQMRVAMQVWRWMESTHGITRNVFHYNALINVCEKIKDWKGALDLLRQMDDESVPKNEITYSSAISACEKGGNWRTALDLLKTMKEKRIMPTAIAYNAAISACEKGLNPSKALEIFDEMKREGVRPTVVTFSALISACEKGQQWKLALQVLEEMKATFGPNVIAYSAAISALSKGQQWEKAWELFCEIEQSGEKLSVVTYNATMTALEKGLQWERALDLFDEMKFKDMPVTVVSYGSAISACEKGYQWRQCLEYLDEMTERKIAKNVIIFGAAMSCMEKSCRADIAFQLMERMNLEGVRPNVHIYNSAISACARCKLWQKGFELFKEMDEVGVKRDVVTYNAVLDAVCSQVDLAEQIFHEGVGRGFYAKVSRLGTQWLELDLHFLSLGGGETALRWWFEKCLVPYLGDSKELASVKSIDIVTGYGKTRARGARKGDDSMRKRVRAMLSFMNVCEVVQPNLGRIHIDKLALMKEVERNCGSIIFDAHGYEQFKLQEGLDEPYSDAPQFVRPRGGALHDRAERDRQQGSPLGLSHDRLDCFFDTRNSQMYASDQHSGNEEGRKAASRYDRYHASDPRGNHQKSPNFENSSCYNRRNDVNRNSRLAYSNDHLCSSAIQSYQSRPDIRHMPDQKCLFQSCNEGRHLQQGEWRGRPPNPRFEPPARHAHPAQSDLERDYQNNHGSLSWQSPTRASYSDRKRSHDRHNIGRSYGEHQSCQHSAHNGNSGGVSFTQDEYDMNLCDPIKNNHGDRRDCGDNSYPNKRYHK